MTGVFGALLAQVGGELFQQAWTVPDLATAQDAMRRSLGCSKFTQFVMTETYDLRGRDTECSLSLGFARAGNMQLELIQPLKGEGIHFEFLERHGAGFHHFGALVGRLDEAIPAAGGLGFKPVMSGQFASIRLTYLDTYDDMGFYVELIEDPENMLWTTRPWRDDASAR
jgi:hypothetical protein